MNKHTAAATACHTQEVVGVHEALLQHVALLSLTLSTQQHSRGTQQQQSLPTLLGTQQHSYGAAYPL